MDITLLGLDFGRPEVVVPFVVGVGAVISLGIVAWVIRVLYRSSVRRSIRNLVQSKEAVKALVGGIAESRSRLMSPQADDKRIAFANDMNSIERLGFADLNSRARILVDELDAMPIPKRVMPIAEALGDIAFLAERAVDTVYGTKGNDAIDTLNAIDVERLTTAMETVEERLEQLAVFYGITEITVYKGGLYV